MCSSFVTFIIIFTATPDRYIHSYKQWKHDFKRLFSIIFLPLFFLLIIYLYTIIIAVFLKTTGNLIIVKRGNGEEQVAAFSITAHLWCILFKIYEKDDYFILKGLAPSASRRYVITNRENNQSNCTISRIYPRVLWPKLQAPTVAPSPVRLFHPKVGRMLAPYHCLLWSYRKSGRICLPFHALFRLCPSTPPPETTTYRSRNVRSGREIFAIPRSTTIFEASNIPELAQNKPFHRVFVIRLTTKTASNV